MDPRALRGYLAALADKLGELGGTFLRDAAEVDDVRLVGRLETELLFPSGARLLVKLVVAGRLNFPEWVSYRFHLMESDGRCIFRYDNSPYHPTASFPYHKHVGPDETVIDSPRPSLAQVIEEVRAAVYRK